MGLRVEMGHTVWWRVLDLLCFLFGFIAFSLFGEDKIGLRIVEMVSYFASESPIGLLPSLSEA